MKEKICEFCGVRPVGKHKHKYCDECSANKYNIRLERDLKTLELGKSLGLCSRCNTNERMLGQVYCRKCRTEMNRQLAKRKQATDPEAYYQETSSTLTCPICNAEFCLSKLPMGPKCKIKICSIGQYTNWQKVLKAKGIRVPEKTEYAPEEIKRLANCIRCKEQPRLQGWLYCPECLALIKKERELEYEALCVLS